MIPAISILFVTLGQPSKQYTAQCFTFDKLKLLFESALMYVCVCVCHAQPGLGGQNQHNRILFALDQVVAWLLNSFISQEMIVEIAELAW